MLRFLIDKKLFHYSQLISGSQQHWGVEAQVARADGGNTVIRFPFGKDFLANMIRFYFVQRLCELSDQIPFGKDFVIRFLLGEFDQIFPLKH